MTTEDGPRMKRLKEKRDDDELYELALPYDDISLLMILGYTHRLFNSVSAPHSHGGLSDSALSSLDRSCSGRRSESPNQ